jgi:hypothetical protein
MDVRDCAVRVTWTDEEEVEQMHWQRLLQIPRPPPSPSSRAAWQRLCADQLTLVPNDAFVGLCIAVLGLVCRTPRQTEEGAMHAGRMRTAMLDRGRAHNILCCC